MQKFNFSSKVILLSLWKEEAISIALDIQSKEINLHSNYGIFHDFVIVAHTTWPRKTEKTPDVQDSLWH